jgi:YaeC family lipoprotein
MSQLLLEPVLVATWQTIYMVFISSFISILLGLALGVVLLITRRDHLKACPWFYRMLGLIVNMVRSVPFVIFMIAIVPLTRILVGTSIGTNAAIVPLTLGAIPFFARIAEAAMAEVNPGLVEAAQSMGATTWQIIYNVLIPESLPSLIKGATLTVIALVGYSAMAGAVGGGGLGELAIQYGYQRFNVPVMVETVLILVILVQILQSYGDYLERSRRLISVTVLCLVLWVASLSGIIINALPQSQQTLTIAIVAGPNQPIMAVAQQVAKQQYDLKLNIVVMSDYVLPNEAVDSGQIDANIFQHIPYLDSQIQQRGFHLAWIGKTFVYPMGVFSRKINSLSQLPYGAVVAIPNDPSNEGRALSLFAAQGLITLKPGVGIMGTVNDVVSNPHGLTFNTLDAAQLPRVFKDAVLVALPNDYDDAAGFKPNQALFHEGPDVPYANIIVVQDKRKNDPVFQKLVDVMHSKPVYDETIKLFPNGAAIPAWKTHFGS